MIRKAGLYYHTIRHLRPVQVFGRVLHNLKRTKISLAPAPEKVFSRSLTPFPHRKQKMFPPRTFEFLNTRFTIFSEQHFSSRPPSLLWHYNLHYFDDLNCINWQKRRHDHLNFIQFWMRANPPGTHPSWTPYPTSLRICNWIKRELKQEFLEKIMLDNLAWQLRHLSQNVEYHLQGNHLFVNGKALLMGGIFFNHGRGEGKKWFEKGLKIINHELIKQVNPDGSHVEQSPMYHCLITEDLLDLINIFQSYRIKIPPNWNTIAKKMVHYAYATTHCDGEISFFNDSAFGIALKPQALYHYALDLGLAAPEVPSNQLLHFPYSGLVRMSKGQSLLIVDFGPGGPDHIISHVHCDTLSFELSHRGQRVLVNSGTGLYEQGKTRSYQRSTAAHNTVEIDGIDQSEVWSAFRLARRAYPSRPQVSNKDPNHFQISCGHTGYHRLPGRVEHSRSFDWSGTIITIKDTISAQQFSHSACCYFHLHPDVSLKKTDTSVEVYRDSGFKTQLLEMSFSCNSQLIQPEVMETQYSPEFGRFLPKQTLKIKCDPSHQIELITRIKLL